MTDCSKRASFLVWSVAMFPITSEIAAIVTYCAPTTEDSRAENLFPGINSRVWQS
jgi:hypothetical protein